MSINLLDLAKNYITPDILQGASKFLGESPAGTTSAIGAILPSLLGGLSSKAATTDGASSIMNMLTQGGHDGSALSSVAGLFSGNSNNHAESLNAGSGIIKSLLGDKASSIIDTISNFSGIKQSSTSSLMSMAAPVLMGLVGKQVSSNGLGVSGLASLLGGQSEHIKSAMPASLVGSLGGALGLGGLLGGATGAVGGAANAMKGMASNTLSSVGGAAGRAAGSIPTGSTGGGGFGKFLPWLLGAALVGALLYFMKGCEGGGAMSKLTDASSAMADKAKDAAGAAANAAGDAAAKAKAAADSLAAKTAAAGGAIADAAGKIFKLSLPGGVILDVPKGSLEDQFATYLGDPKSEITKDKWFDFDRLLFETGKSTLKPESQEQVKNAAAILKAFPKVEIKIGGYTDNKGNASSNVKLSQSRAESVLAELEKLGVEGKRMKAEGYGDAHPIALNDTEEGRAKNRRIAIRATAK